MSSPTDVSADDRATNRESAERERFWIRIQAASGLAFSLFLTLHLANTVAAPGGEATFNAVQDGARRFYQTMVFEILLVATPLVTHVVASAVRIVQRRRRGRSERPTLRTRLHRWTGWFLLAAIGGHVTATRLVPLATDTQIRFGDLNFTTVIFGVPFSIYYILLGSCGTYHLLNGLTVATRVFGVRWPSELAKGPAFWAPVAAFVLAVAIGVAAFSGWIFPVGPELWGDSSAVIAEYMGTDLESVAGR